MKVNGELDNGLVRYESKSEIMYSDRFAGFVGFAGADISKLPLFKTELLPSAIRGFSDSLKPVYCYCSRSF